MTTAKKTTAKKKPAEKAPEAPSGVADEQGPDETAPAAPVADQDAPVAPEPVQTSSGVGYHNPYSTTLVDRCDDCGHNHGAGQFKACQGCGRSFDR